MPTRFIASVFDVAHTIRASTRVSKCIVLSTLMVCAGPLGAQWTLVPLHAAVQQGDSRVLGVSSTHQVGVSGGRAIIWSGTSNSAIDLNPPEFGFSWAYGISGTTRVGSAYILAASGIHAIVWSGTPPTAASWSDLNPPGAFNSEAYATNGTQHVGHAFINGFDRAVLWNGNAGGGNSWVDLHPPGASQSLALGTNGVQQVGCVINGSAGGNQIAALWSGSAASWINLNPSGASGSCALGIAGNQQVGYASTSNGHHACLWNGTPESWVDLSPYAPGADMSDAFATNGTYQVGFARIVDDRAWLWSYSTGTHVDLHALLPAQYGWSTATSVWSDATHDYVGGYGYNTDTERDEALLWMRIRTPVCPADIGIQGGTPGQDGLLDNNDFVVFINFFFATDPRADVGRQGGLDGGDGQFDNNDFVVYINRFFQGC